MAEMEGMMPYKINGLPRPVSSKNWLELCPKCKRKKRVKAIYDTTNAYGCNDSTHALELECGHLLWPWERAPFR